MADVGGHSVHPGILLHNWLALCSRNVRPRRFLGALLLSNCRRTNSCIRPRWLLEKKRPDAAQKSLQYLRGQDDNPEAVAEELAEIKESIDAHNSVAQASWHYIFSNKDMFRRLWRGAVLQFMAQTCGATAIKYYLPTVFLALGLSKDMSLMAGGIESTLKIGCTIIEMMIIDKVGRRGTLIIGSSIMCVSTVVCTWSVHGHF